MELPQLRLPPPWGHSVARRLPALIAVGAGAAQLPVGCDSKVNKQQLWGL